MSTKLKLYLCRKVIESLDKSTKFTSTELLPLIRVGKNDNPNSVEMTLPLDILELNLGIANINQIYKIKPDDIIKKITFSSNRANRKLSFDIDKNIFIRDVIENGAQPDVNFNPKKIVFEYSSPNVAKPFHFGHLRSTIVGNFLSNLHSFLFNKVKRLNYLGDWGTQFGFIKIGVDELKYTDEDIKKNPLKLLYKSYVHANKLAEHDAEISERAKREFLKLESGSLDYTKYWSQYMNYTKDELAVIYSRLGVTFDEYNYESMYSSKQIQDVLSILEKRQIIQKDADGKKTADLGNRKVAVLKSDGSTLYLTRDIAAAIDRYKKYNFDRMYYVVDNSQTEHFKALKNILLRMDLPWATRIHHVKFGRIRGMSTRKGNAVFLKDILDECRDLMIKRQISSPTTKIRITNSETSDILGVSCVIINDLKQRRQKDYEFALEKVLQVHGDTGIKLQYTHCRLHNLEQNSDAIRPKDCVPEMLKEPEAMTLIKEIAKFQSVLYHAEEQFEACVLVTYLFHLCGHINRAVEVLRVKGADPDLASQRLLLFITAKQVLNSGMTILGLKPLCSM